MEEGEVEGRFYGWGRIEVDGGSQEEDVVHIEGNDEVGKGRVSSGKEWRRDRMKAMW